MPSIIITASRTSSRPRVISSDSATRVRSMKVRETDDFDVDRACCSTSCPTGSCVRRKRRVETPASTRSRTERDSGSRSAKYS
jgi:hypothetical protein